jgi:hypothetical protein
MTKNKKMFSSTEMLYIGFRISVLHSGHQIRLICVKQYSHSSPHYHIGTSTTQCASGLTVHSEHKGL